MGREHNSSKCNLTLVLYEKQHLELEQRPVPCKPRPNEVTLATHTVGICGSDVKYWQQGKIGNFVVTKPMILGHETSAVVIDVGENVKHLKPGDKVAAEVGVPCSTCDLCRKGKYNLCEQMQFAATPPYDGTLTRYFNHPADFCFKLPEGVSLEEGALLEPLAVAVHACKRAQIKLGDTVLVSGAGAVGLLCMMTARAFGANLIVVTDVNEQRLKFAKELGADRTVVVQRNEFPQQLAARLKSEHFGGRGVDVILECSGAETSMVLAINVARTGGTIVCVGCQPDLVTIPLQIALMQEIDIKGLFRYRNCYPIALSMVESGRINLRPLITHRFKLEDATKAFELCSRGEGVKILIKCMDESQLQNDLGFNGIH
ncbi:Sorbitol dehydrogenase [Fragariocoptes setiger]|uniref:Sorbitol dehydrogenase n=1 Tax=Fragariocoptes setiger TaxID=1670756 RepID=A0ABQ7S796_9ACAR|nr:Sorbitol dehydrogenase [Fragariocoptes setiger]